MLNNDANSLKKLGLAITAGSMLALSSVTQATTIDFSEVGLFEPDPVISGYAFSAGDAANFEDTFTDDALNLGDAYLSSGWDSLDILGLNGFDTTFINIGTAAVGGNGFDTTINLQAAFDAGLPSGLDLQMDVYLGAVLQASDTLHQTQSPPLENMQVILNDIAFDTIYLYDTATVGGAFRIDNLVVNSVDNTGPGPGPGPIPEPSILLLFGTALFSLGMTRRITKG